MNKILMPPLAVAAAVLLAFKPVQAATGRITGFTASATTVSEGSVVDFLVNFELTTRNQVRSHSDPEPAPAEGGQYWTISSSSATYEWVSDVWLSANGMSFREQPQMAPGSTYSGTWAFSLLFPTEGSFDVKLSGGWYAPQRYESNTEYATRDCSPTSGGGLACSPWDYSSYSDSDNYGFEDRFLSKRLTINVVPGAVPEPASLALLLAGGVVVAGWRSRQRGATSRRV